MWRRLRFEALEHRVLLAADIARIPADLLAQLEIDAKSEPTGIIVRYQDEAVAKSSEIELLHASQGIVEGRTLPLIEGLERLELPTDAALDDVLSAYRSDPNVLYAEPDYILRTTAVPDDPRYGELWGLNNVGQTGGTSDIDIDAPEVWDASTGSSGTLVAVIDTGVDYTHEDLAGNIWVNMAEANGLPGVDDDGNNFIDDIHGYDFANDDGDPMDDQGHGTHVAGTIGAVGNNGIGITGVNWDVQIMAVKFLAADGTGSTSDAIDAINYAVQMNAQISNNSWGGNEPFSQAMYDAIEAAQAKNHIFVAGAGNGFFGFPLNNDVQPFYPATFDLDNIISVAATDHNNQIASFSNYGATSVDLAAPGVDILSTRPNNNYELLSGTSMATPHVTGVVALVVDQFPTMPYREVIDLVLDNVVPNPVLQGITVTGGNLNAAKTLPPTEREISVSLDGQEISDGGAVDFGTSLLQVPQQHTFTVTNRGLTELVLDNQITLPAGYTLAAPLGDTTLGFRESTTFTVQLDAAATGQYSGELVLLSNDEDESPYNITLASEVSVTDLFDDLDAVFDVTGTWETHTDPPGALGGGFHYNAAGVGDDIAAWSIDIAPARYEVWASWSASNNRATNSPFQIFDDNYLLATERHNQRLGANDVNDGGVGWESLGIYDFTSSNLQVKLSDDADGFVIADGIRVQRVGELSADANIGVTHGGVEVADETGAVDFGSTIIEAPAKQTFAVRNTGLQPLTLGATISVPDGFSVASGFSATTLASGEQAMFEVQLDAGFVGEFAGEVSFSTNDPGAAVFNFSVSGVVVDSLIIDNGQSGFATVGSWGASSSPAGAMNSTFLYNAKGTGADQASWTFDLPAGEYQISASWSASFNRATNAPFKISNGNVTLTTINVDQKTAANDFQDESVWWESFGDFNLNASGLEVLLTDAANNYVIADAIRVQRLDLPPSPHVRVAVDGQALVDGQSDVQFGETLLDAPVTKTFVVSNVGELNLQLGSTINVPDGFSLVEGFGSQTLAPGASTDFTLRLDANAAGLYDGAVSFTTNDTEAPLFDFDIDGAVNTSLIIDNGDSEFSVSGAWTHFLNEGRDNDIHFSAAGTGADVAAWTIPLPPGKYEIAATWNAAANRATDSPFRVHDQETLISTVRLNQESAPNDLADDGSNWERLGQFAITSGSLKLTLADDANEYVIADGVRIERVGDLDLGPEIDVLVDGVSLTSGSAGVDFGQTLVASPVTKEIIVRNVGQQDLILSDQVVTPAGYSVASSFDDLVLSVGEQTSLQLRFDAAADGTASGEFTFTSNDGDESPFSIDVTAQATSILVVDNEDVGFSTTGAWTHWLNEGYQNSIHFSAAGTGADVATWSVDLPPGEYEVAATWNAVSNRATNSPFTVLDGSFALSTVLLNQEFTPNDITDFGVGWESLGTFRIVSGQLNVQLSDDADQYVIADAIRVVRVGDLPNSPQIELFVNDEAVAAGGDVDFGSVMIGGPETEEFVVRNSGLQSLVLDSSISLPNGFSLASGFDTLNVAPGGLAKFSVELDADNEGAYTGPLTVTSNAANADPLTVDLNGEVATTRIIDNGDAGFSMVGWWGTATNPPGALNNAFLFNQAGSGADTATWTFNVPAGRYQVAASWSASYNRATNAPYTILDGATTLATVTVNQMVAANDFTDAGVAWENLGEVIVNGDTLNVRLSDQANNYVIADAIRIERTGSGATWTIAGGQGGPSVGHPAVVVPANQVFVASSAAAPRYTPVLDSLTNLVATLSPSQPFAKFQRELLIQQSREPHLRERIWSDENDWWRDLLDEEAE